MISSIVLAAVLLGGSPGGPSEVQEERVEKPILPGDSGYVLKRAREMVELSRTRDAEARTELLLVQSRERLRERETLGSGPFGPEASRVARGLGDSYRQLTLEGAPGTIECGVAEGRDMKPAQKRYLESLASDRSRWERVVSSLPPDERSAQEPVLRVTEEAPGRSQQAEAAGLDFLKKERARKEAVPTPAPERPDAPKPPPAAVPPAPPAPLRPSPDVPSARTDPQLPKSDPERPKKEDDGETPRHAEHHPHPHRPHH